MGEFRMPSLGADMDEGTLVEWRVRVGDHVQRGDIVAVVDTDKAVIDVEVFETGVVEDLLVQTGTKVPVGTPLARIAPDGAAAPRVPPPPVAPSAPRPIVPSTAAPAAALPVSGSPGRHQASVVLSPLVRRLADQRGVDLRRVVGSGPGNRVTRSDVERATGRAAPAGPASPRARRRAAEQGIDLAAVTGSGPSGAVRERDVLASPTTSTAPADRRTTARRATARSMERSNREIPHYHLATTIDLEPALIWLEEVNGGRAAGERLIPAVLLLRAVALAAGDVPEVNGWWVDGDLRVADVVDLGVAVALRGGGILTPTVARAETGSLPELMGRLRDVVERARRGSLRSSDMVQASISVTNLGDRGADLVNGVIHPPQVALVGFGRIAPRPVVVDEVVVAHRTVAVTLAGDHRASDGHVGSRFLAGIDRLLTAPARLDAIVRSEGAGQDTDPAGGPTHGS